MHIVSRKSIDLSFWKGRRVLLTGHTGFKGAWLSRILITAGAEVTGFALQPTTEPSLFVLCGLERQMRSVIADIRDRTALTHAYEQARPEVVLHLAAQPLVREAYIDPVRTYETNVLGALYLLECARTLGMTRSLLNVTTDKVYQNNEWCRGYCENDVLDGHDPYSNSKSCSELVTRSYRRSFFGEGDGPVAAISTARAGNAIGGGDFARDRILPDCVRAAMQRKPIAVRNPNAIRPYQHVLEPLLAYLLIAQRQYEDPACAGEYNVGPDDADCVSTGALVDLFCQAWGEGQTWESGDASGPHEANFLKLDCSKIHTTLGWLPRWNIAQAVERTVAWTKTYAGGGDVAKAMDEEISAYLRG